MFNKVQNTHPIYLKYILAHELKPCSCIQRIKHSFQLSTPAESSARTNTHHITSTTCIRLCVGCPGWMFLYDKLRQPRNSHQGIVSALFGIFAPLTLVPTLTTNMVSGGHSTFKKIVNVT